MSKLIRFDEDHYGYLVDVPLRHDEMTAVKEYFEEYFEGKKLLVCAADEFIDLTGKYEIVPIREPLATEPIVGVPV
jgi:hypothetical protein